MPSQQVPLQRVGPLAVLPDLLAEFGVPLAAVLDGSGIAEDAFLPEARFPMPDLIRVLERAAALARCPHLGLLLGTRQDHRALGIIGEMMSSAPTLGDALKAYVGLQIGYSRSAIVYLHRLGGDYVLGYGVYDPYLGAGRQVYDLVIAVGCNMVRNLTGGRVRPARILLCCSRPEDPGIHHSLLKAPVLFDQEQTCLVISAADMAAPLPGADAPAHRRLREAAEKMAGEHLDDVAARVRHALRPRLMIGEANRDCVAQELGIGERTLARQLAAAGTSFEAIKDEVRHVVARELLALTRLPVGQVGGAVSYATHSAFDRAFRRWSGLSPSEWRLAHAAG